MIELISREFIEQSIFRIDESTKRIEKCFQEVDDAEIWLSPNENSNSIGNLVLHLCGNIRQYIISALGKNEDVRERDREFSAKKGYTKTELLNKLSVTINEAIEIIKKCREKDLAKIYSVQGFSLSGVGIIIHVTEHYSYHTGQMLFGQNN